MLLELSQILDSPGASVPFSAKVDLQDLRRGDCTLAEPVTASGTVHNVAGVLTMKGTVTGVIHGVCDRCAADFTSDVSMPIDAVLVTELSSLENEDEGVFLLENGCADLDEIVRTVFVLNLDSQLLCRPDCKGICCRCGKNLNDGPCDCQKEPDSRFAVLQQLLDR